MLDTKDIVKKIEGAIKKKWGGMSESDQKKLFEKFAEQGNKLSPKGMEKLLKYAEVGNRFTRSSWVKSTMKMLDLNKDGYIKWDEYRSLLSQGSMPGAVSSAMKWFKR